MRWTQNWQYTESLNNKKFYFCHNDDFLSNDFYLINTFLTNILSQKIVRNKALPKGIEELSIENAPYPINQTTQSFAQSYYTEQHSE